MSIRGTNMLPKTKNNQDMNEVQGQS